MGGLFGFIQDGVNKFQLIFPFGGRAQSQAAEFRFWQEEPSEEKGKGEGKGKTKKSKQDGRRVPVCVNSISCMSLPPVVPFDPFLGEGSPTKLQKKGYPYSILSTGGPGQSDGKPANSAPCVACYIWVKLGRLHRRALRHILRGGAARVSEEEHRLRCPCPAHPEA